MADPPGMHQLHEDFAAGLMDTISDASPALHLFFVEKSGNACIAKAIG